MSNTNVGAEQQHLVNRCKEVLVSQGERLLAAKVKVLGVVVDEFRLRGSSSLGTGLGNAVKGHKALPRDVVDLVLGLGVS